MSLRRTVRQAIKTGSIIYGTVESYRLGRATVVLNDFGTRLTNLSTIGGEVAPGQTVVVDYSAGIDPVVRPEFVETSDTALETIAPDFVDDEVQIADEDYGCLAWHQGSYEENLVIHDGQPFLLPFGWNQPASYEMAGAWDSGGMIDWSTNPGRNYLLVPKDGKYIVHVTWNEFWAGIAVSGPDLGHCKFRVLKNGTAVCEKNARNQEGRDYQPGMYTTFIEEFSAGDQVQLELTSRMGDYLIDNWGYYCYSTRHISLQYIPGT